MRKLISIVVSLFLFASTCYSEAGRSWSDSGTERVSPGNVNDVTTGNLTIGLWVKLTEDASSDGLIVKKRAETVANIGYAMYQTNTDLISAAVGDGAVNLTCSSGRDNDGIWTFAVLTWDGTGNNLVLYENLAQSCSPLATPVGSLTTTFNFNIGNNGLAGNAANGVLSHAFFYPVILNSWQMAELKCKPDTPVRVGTYSYWPVWGQSGGNEKDYSPSNVTAAVTGTTLSTDGPPIMLAGGLPL